ncbi:MAG: aspartate-semialdehyde dehydrogenase, partial [Nitrosopumilaceae archaeon]
MKRVAIIGVTGAVGQEFVVALNNHPWFEVKQIAASERSAGKKFVDAIRDTNTGILKWHIKEEIPEYVKNMIVESVDDIKPENLDLIFTSIESEAAREIETRFAKDVPIISTSSAYRYEPDVPILIPGIND